MKLLPLFFLLFYVAGFNAGAKEIAKEIAPETAIEDLSPSTSVFAKADVPSYSIINASKAFYKINADALSGQPMENRDRPQANPSDRSLIGVWTYSGGSIEFNADGSGALKMKNRNSRADCPEGSVTNFNWTVDHSQLRLNYTSMYICGEKQPTPEADDPKTYSIAGNTLQWAGVSWTKE